MSQLTPDELKLFQTFYDKMSDPCCEECMAEADAALSQIKHYFRRSDLLPILQERSRCLAMGLDRSSAGVRMKQTLKHVLGAMRVPLAW